MKLKAFLLFFLLSSFSLLQAADKPLIKIETERTSLIYQVADNGRLYQKYLGKKLNHDSDIQYLPQGTEAYLTHGMEDYFEPAIHIRHNDNNSSLLLKYVDHSSNAISNGVVRGQSQRRPGRNGGRVYDGNGAGFGSAAGGPDGQQSLRQFA